MKKHKKLLKDSLIPDDAKPIIGVENDEILHPVFFRQFLRHYKLLRQDKTNFTALVLSGLFLHLALESYITWITRWLLKNVNRRKNRRLTRLWENHFESNANLNRKVQFFVDSFLNDTDMSEVKKIEKFIGELSALRNKIVHGHEFSVTRWSDGSVKKTKFAELLTFKKIDYYYSGFKSCMGIISVLFKEIDLEDMTSGIPSKDWVIDHLTFSLGGE